MQFDFVLYSFVAGIFASLACGLGALPLLIKRFDVTQRIGYAYAFAGGLMFAASVYNLLLPALTLPGGSHSGSMELWPVLQTLIGILLGSAFIWFVEGHLSHEAADNKYLRALGGRTGALVFIAMTFHSIPEGVAVGVAFASESYGEVFAHLGPYVALAIGIHNIPEGLAVALPLRAKGASINKCFWMAVITSLPQPFAAIPASLLVWLFKPLMLPMFGFAAGAMMYLVIVELIPDSLETHSRSQVASAFMVGFSAMILVQVLF